MIRADYCGNGTSYTLNGRPINVYDALDIQLDTEAWRFEAEWTPAGARCVAERRVVFVDGRAPGCGFALPSLGCGDRTHFASGTLLMEEHEAQFQE